MRRLLLSFILICLLAVPASAHPGGTDSSGGHYDHSTGEYHYHHGYPAHDHTDLDGDGDLDCPYNFKDKTGENSEESSGSTTRYPVYTRPSAPLPTMPAPTVAEPEPESFLKTAWEVVKVIGIVIVAFVVMLLGMMAFFAPIMAIQFAVLWLREHFGKRRKEPEWRPSPQRIPGKRPELLEPPKPAILDDRGRLEQLVRKFGRPGYEEVKFPPELRLSKDGNLYWGDLTVNRPHGDGTVYITGRSGRCWHLNRGCRGAEKPVLIYRAMFDHEPCSLCVPKDACPPRIPVWYHHFVELRTREYHRSRD